MREPRFYREDLLLAMAAGAAAGLIFFIILYTAIP